MCRSWPVEQDIAMYTKNLVYTSGEELLILGKKKTQIISSVVWKGVY